MLKKLKKNKIFLTAITVMVVGSFLVGNVVGAQNTLDTVDCGWNFICHFGKILLYIVQFEGYVAGLLMTIFTTIIKVSKFTDAAAVKLGWALVRDLTNMFFVLVVLAIAIGTILRIESYNLKKALPRVVIMAVLVNFSLVIFGLITDFAQVIMASFIAIIQDGLNNDVLVKAFGLPDLTVAGDKINQGNQATTLGSGDVIVTIIFAIIMMLIAIMVIFVMLVVILLRTIMLWLLAVLSPLPYLLSAFPQGKKYAAMWWSEFAKYLIIGPAFAFFLWLSLAVVTVKDQSQIFGDQVAIDNIGSAGEGDPSISDRINNAGVFSEGSQPPNVLNFIIAIGMLLGGLILTQRAGVAGAGLAGSAYNKIRSTGLKAPGVVGAWTTRKIKAGKVPIVGKYTRGLELNPMNILRGIQKSRETKREREIIEGSAASGEALKKGGIGGLVKGLGASRDWADAYIQGAGNLKGFSNMVYSVVGGPKAVDKIMGDVDQEKDRAAKLLQQSEMRDNALNLSDTGRLKAAREHFLSEESLESRVSDISNKRVSGTQEEKDQYNYLTQEKEVIETEGKKKVTKVVKERVFIDDVMKAAGIDPTQTPDQLEAAGDFEAAFKKREFLDSWDKQQAKADASKEFATLEEKFNNNDADAIATINNLSGRHFENQFNKKEQEINRIQSGGLSDDELNHNQKQLIKLNRDIAGILTKIAKKESRGLSTVQEKEELRKKEEAAQLMGTKVGNLYELNRSQQMVEPADTKAKEEFRASRSKLVQDLQSEKEQFDWYVKSKDWTADDRENVRGESTALKNQAAEAKKAADLKEASAQKYVPPTAFYALRDWRALVNQEQGKITSELDSELLSNLKDAIGRKDTTQSIALMKKLAADANDNEIWNSFGFRSGSEGMHDFFDAVVIGKKGIKKADGTVYNGPALGLDEQTSHSVENDISFINEGVKHWETARVMEVKNGQFKRLDEKDHTKAALAEIMKANTRDTARALNRLAYGGERPNPDGTRDFEISMLGRAIIRALGPDIAGRIEGGEYNKNAIMNIGTVINELEQDGRVDPSYINSVRTTFDKLSKEAGADIPSIVDQLFRDYQRR